MATSGAWSCGKARHRREFPSKNVNLTGDQGKTNPTKSVLPEMEKLFKQFAVHEIDLKSLVPLLSEKK